MTNRADAFEQGLAMARAPQRGRGVTLIELLVVMAVVVLLAALTLPSVKTLLKDQRTSQSARVVQGFIESARARAIASGRPIAVIFERSGEVDSDTSGLQTCARMSIGEVFPPYEGDWAGTTGVLVDVDGDGYADAIDVPAAQAATLPTIVTDGDFIELGQQRLGFSINGIPQANQTNYRVSFSNPIQYVDSTKSTPITVYLSEKRPILAGTGNVRFRIYRKPSKTMTGTVVLPRGTCIDLAWSGLGQTGTEFATSAINSPGAKRSIFMVFNASGAIDSVYEFQQNAAGSSVYPATAVLGIWHLLVGRSDQVNLPTTAVSERDDVRANVIDPGNNWVSINGFTGRVYTSNVAAPSAAYASIVAGARFFATQGVTGKGG